MIVGPINHRSCYYCFCIPDISNKNLEEVPPVNQVYVDKKYEAKNNQAYNQKLNQYKLQCRLTILWCKFEWSFVGKCH